MRISKKILTLIIAFLFLSSNLVAEGINLRPRIGTKQISDRLQEVFELRVQYRHLIQSRIIQLEKERKRLYSQLEEAFEQALKRLNTGEIDDGSIRDCFTSKRTEKIYNIIGRIRKREVKLAILKDDMIGFLNLTFHENKCSTAGLCVDIAECFGKAAYKRGLEAYFYRHLYGQGAESVITHSYPILITSGGNYAIDFSSGQFIPENAGKPIIEPLNIYKYKMQAAIDFSYGPRKHKNNMHKIQTIKRKFLKEAETEINVIAEVKDVSIEILPQPEYKKFAEELYTVSKERAYEPDRYLSGMAKEIERDSLDMESQKMLLSVIVARGTTGKILGVRILYKPQHIQELGLNIVSGDDIVMEKYREMNIATKLRLIALVYLLKAGYEAYEVAVREGNLASYNNIVKICDKLGIPRRNISRIKDAEGQGFRRYLIRLKEDISLSDKLTNILLEDHHILTHL